MSLESFAVALARRRPRLGKFFTTVARKAFPESVVVLDYPVASQPRWHQQSPHRFLYDIINVHRAAYKQRLQSFLPFASSFARIPVHAAADADPREPAWINGWLPAMDGVALYSFLALNNPAYFMEVGSGHSTKFARKAIVDHQLRTKIISIDPCPRAEVDGICDRIIREPVERVGLEIFDDLGAGDILYIDSSHRVFMNSDVTTLFLDVLPRLKPGILIQIHDVTIPYDYPAQWQDRYYSEQYLLAAYLLAEGDKLEIMLPSTFISDDPELKSILSPLWTAGQMGEAETFGCSFWIRVRGRE